MTRIVSIVAAGALAGFRAYPAGWPAHPSGLTWDPPRCRTSTKELAEKLTLSRKKEEGKRKTLRFSAFSLFPFSFFLQAAFFSSLLTSNAS
jgi:hypothetical protein